MYLYNHNVYYIDDAIKYDCVKYDLFCAYS